MVVQAPDRTVLRTRPKIEPPGPMSIPDVPKTPSIPPCGDNHAYSPGTLLCISSYILVGLLIILLPIVFIGFNPPHKGTLNPANRTVLDLLQGESLAAPTRLAVRFAQCGTLRWILAILPGLIAVFLRVLNRWKTWGERTLLGTLLLGLAILVLNLIGLLSIIAVV